MVSVPGALRTGTDTIRKVRFHHGEGFHQHGHGPQGVPVRARPGFGARVQGGRHDPSEAPDVHDGRADAPPEGAGGQGDGRHRSFRPQDAALPGDVPRERRHVPQVGP